MPRKAKIYNNNADKYPCDIYIEKKIFYQPLFATATWWFYCLSTLKKTYLRGYVICKYSSFSVEPPLHCRYGQEKSNNKLFFSWKLSKKSTELGKQVAEHRDQLTDLFNDNRPPWCYKWIGDGRLECRGIKKFKLYSVKQHNTVCECIQTTV